MKEGFKAKDASSGEGITVEITSSPDCDIKASIAGRSMVSCCWTSAWEMSFQDAFAQKFWAAPSKHNFSNVDVRNLEAL